MSDPQKWIYRTIYGIHHIIDEEYSWVATVAIEHRPLITAAPNLLAACEDLVAQIQNCRKVPNSNTGLLDSIGLAQAQDAITKAKND